MPKAVIYARVSSTAESDDISTSIPDQISDCEALAARLGYDVVGRYSDKGISGRAYPTGEPQAETDDETKTYLSKKRQSRKTRDGLANVFKVLRAHKASILIVREVTRLYRPVSKSAFLTWIPAQLEKLGVTLSTCDGQSIPPNQATAWIIPHVLSIINDSEIKKRHQYSQQRIGGLLDAGTWIYNTPYGFKQVHETSNRRKVKYNYTIDKEQAKVLNRIFADYANGKPMGQIVRNLNAEKIPSPGGSKWIRTMTVRMITNPIYMGKIKNSKGRMIDCTNMPEVVPLDVVMQARKVRESNQKTRTRETQKNEYLMSSLLFCGHCGKRLFAISKKSKGLTYSYYHCTGKNDLGTKDERQSCAESTLNQQDTDKFFEAFAVAGAMKEIDDLKKNGLARLELPSLRSEMDRLLKREEELIDIEDKQQRDRAMATINAKIQTLQEKIDKLAAMPEPTTFWEVKPMFYTGSGAPRKYLTPTNIPTLSMVQKKKYVRDVVEKVVVSLGKMAVTFTDGQVLEVARKNFHLTKFTPSIKVEEVGKRIQIQIVGDADKHLLKISGVDIVEVQEPEIKLLSMQNRTPIYEKVLGLLNKGEKSKRELINVCQMSDSCVTKAIERMLCRRLIIRTRPGFYSLP